MDSKNQRLFVFCFDAAFFKIFCIRFFNVNHWQYFLFTAPLKTAPTYVNLKPKVDTVCFQRTKVFLWGRILVKIQLNSCLLPSINILLAVWFLSLTTHRSKFLPQEVQVNFWNSFDCYLMSLMLLNVFVLRKFLWFFELVSFFIILVNILLILSKYSSTFPPYRVQLILWPIVLTKGFLPFGTTSFHTKFPDYRA